MIMQLFVLLMQFLFLLVTLYNLNEAIKRDRQTLTKLKELNEAWFLVLKELNKLPGDEWKNS